MTPCPASLYMEVKDRMTPTHQGSGQHASTAVQTAGPTLQRLLKWNVRVLDILSEVSDISDSLPDTSLSVFVSEVRASPAMLFNLFI